jgi:hypothetical protein
MAEAMEHRVTRPARRARRTAFSVGAGVLALLAGGALVLTGDREPQRPAEWVQAPAGPVPFSHPPFTVKPVHGRLGEVVETGLAAAPGTEWVLSFVPEIRPATPDLTISLSIGERDKAGTIVEALAISDDRLTDHATGFHPMQAPMQLMDGSIQPAFGYYIGRLARITAVFDGVTTVAAHLVT